MLAKIIGYTVYEDRVPHVRHIFYPVLIIAVGYKCAYDYDWWLFGVLMIVIGTLLAIAVIISIGWRGPIEYWSQIQSTIEAMNRIKDPAVWQAMGFREIPNSVEVIEKHFDETNKYPSFKIKHIPIPPVVLNSIANTVLTSQNLDFTEEKYKAKVPNWRKSRKELIEKGYVVPKNKNNVRGGYMFSHKGLNMLYEYADAAIVRMIEKEKNGTKE